MSDNENMTELENTETTNSAKDKNSNSDADQGKNGDTEGAEVKMDEGTIDSDHDSAKESGDESGEEDENQQKEALFEAPVVVEGKRERKKTERLSITSTEKEKKAIVIPEGKGVKLGDIPFTSAMLNKRKSEDVNLLHRCLYHVQGDPPTRKVNIRKFCGFTFEKGSSEYEKKLDFLSRVYKDLLVTQFTSVLGLKGSAKKEDMVQTIMDFLMKPQDSGAKPPETKKKKAKTPAKKKEKKSSDKKKKPAKKKASEDTVDSDSDSGDEDAADDESKAEKKSTPKKKPKKPATPKSKSKAEKKETKKKDSPKSKTPKKKPKPPKKELSSVSESDSDDEPLVKKIKLKVPDDDDIRDLVSKILDSSSLEELSIRKVFQQVQDHYPGIDLSDKQKYVKTTVKELIN